MLEILAIDTIKVLAGSYMQFVVCCALQELGREQIGELDAQHLKW
jgi:hypothetical protein